MELFEKVREFTFYWRLCLYVWTNPGGLNIRKNLWEVISSLLGFTGKIRRRGAMNAAKPRKWNLYNKEAVTSDKGQDGLKWNM